MLFHLLPISWRERGSSNLLLVGSCHCNLNVHQVPSINVDVLVDPQVFNLRPIEWLASVAHCHLKDHVLSELLTQSLHSFRQGSRTTLVRV